MFRNIAVLIVAIVSISTASFAAEITVQNMDNTSTKIIEIDGEIVEGDAAKFQTIFAETDKAVVALNSPGGNVGEALEITQYIRTKKYMTYISENYPCDSACAFIWLAGSKRFMDRHAKAGFHAAYTSNNGVKQETGVGNAILGHYYASLHLPLKAVVFMTSASPENVNYITADNAASYGIKVSVFGNEISHKKNHKNIPEAPVASTETAPAKETTPEAAPKIESAPSSSINFILTIFWIGVTVWAIFAFRKSGKKKKKTAPLILQGVETSAPQAATLYLKKITAYVIAEQYVPIMQDLFNKEYEMEIAAGAISHDFITYEQVYENGNPKPVAIFNPKYFGDNRYKAVVNGLKGKMATKLFQKMELEVLA